MEERKILFDNGLKRCSRCKDVKRQEEFHRNKSSWDNFFSQCRECVATDTKKYRENNKSSLKKRKAKYYKDNKKKISERAKEYRDDNPELMREQSLKYRLGHIEEIQKRKADYYQKNKEKIFKQSKEDRELNPEKWSERNKKSLKRAVSFKTYGHRFTPDDKAADDNGILSVACKLCSKMFQPARSQVKHRIECLDGKSAGESNFYCSESCKDVCPVYHFDTNKVDPRSKRYVDSLTADAIRKCNSGGKHLKQLQCDEYAHNFCEKCGDIIDVELHHTLEISKHSNKSINSSTHMLLCAGCHTNIHKDC